MRTAQRLGSVLVWLGGLPAVAWAVAAVWIDGPLPPALGAAAALIVAAAGLAVLLWLRGARRVLGLVALVGIVAAWWVSLLPRNDRDWLPDVANPPWAEISGDRVTIRNLRDFTYPGDGDADFTERWETRTYNLAALRGIDLFLSFWGPTAIAHTVMSWEFADGPPLAISIETRKERGESYSAVLGFFRQYELYYVVADERDVIGVRTGHRGEQVYLYRIRMPPERARELLLDYLGEINRLRDQPEWYNAFSHNCTTGIRRHLGQIGLAGAWDWRILANGYLDQLAHERGTIDNSLPFEEMRRRSEITAAARAADGAEDFSARIRADLPAARGVAE